MIRRILPFSLVACASLLAYACSSSSDDSPGTQPTEDGGTVLDDGAVVDQDGNVIDGASGDGAVSTNNPIEGVGNPTSLGGAFVGLRTDGPVWKGDSLFYATVGVPSYLVRLAFPSDVQQVGQAAGSTAFQATTIDGKSGALLTAVVNTDAMGNASATGGGAIVKTDAKPSTAPATAASAPLTVNFVGDGGALAFDSPNDLVTRKDGTIYVTDPGYSSLATVSNHVWRLKPNGAAYDAFETKAENRPNGIALSSDEKTLFVSFSQPPAPSDPAFISKYTVNADGSLADKPVKFADVGPAEATALDGLAIDSAGNIYAAVATGVDVFKPDGTKWGHLTTPKPANNVAFGGPDLKKLVITGYADTWTVDVKVAGIAQ